MKPKLQREFFRTAALWLDARLRLTEAGECDGASLGEIDARAELYLICREAKASR